MTERCHDLNILQCYEYLLEQIFACQINQPRERQGVYQLDMGVEKMADNRKNRFAHTKTVSYHFILFIKS